MSAYWSYADLAREFQLSQAVIRRRMPAWAAEGFPAPVPWRRREKLWHPESVVRWKERQELRALARAPDLRIVA